MARYYIVSKDFDKSDYELIKIDNGDSLEDIDLYTSHFKNKENFVEHLRANGLNVSSDTDLFIAYRGKNGVSYKEVIFNTKGKHEKDNEIVNLAIKSKEKKCSAVREYAKLRNIMRSSEKFNILLERGAIHISKFLKEEVEKMFHTDKIVFKSNKWLISNYMIARDTVYAMDVYESVRNKFSDKLVEEMVADRKRKFANRNEIAQALSAKIDQGLDQYSLFPEPTKSITLNVDSINIDKFNDSHDLKLKESKSGFAFPSEDKDTGWDNNSMYYFLINKMPYGSIREVKKPGKKYNTYEINFDKLEEKYDHKFSEEEKRSLNGLLGTDIKRNLLWIHVYGSTIDPSKEAKKELAYYKFSLKKTLLNYKENRPTMYDKAIMFCDRLSEITKEKRGGYGSK